MNQFEKMFLQDIETMNIEFVADYKPFLNIQFETQNKKYGFIKTPKYKKVYFDKAYPLCYVKLKNSNKFLYLDVDNKNGIFKIPDEQPTVFWIWYRGDVTYDIRFKLYIRIGAIFVPKFMYLKYNNNSIEMVDNYQYASMFYIKLLRWGLGDLY